MRVPGYKLKGYDATYDRVMFDVRYGFNAEKKRVLEVTEINSGITFIFETEPIDQTKSRRRKRKQNPKKNPCKV